MKLKAWMMVAAAGAILGGCSNVDQNAENENGLDTETAVSEEKPAAEKQEPELTPAEEKEESKSNTSAIVEDSGEERAAVSYPEYDTIMKQVSNGDYVFNVETDNPDTRVMFIMDGEGERIYKTIFVKDERRLKIMQLGDEGEIFNDRI